MGTAELVDLMFTTSEIFQKLMLNCSGDRLIFYHISEKHNPKFKQANTPNPAFMIVFDALIFK